ncbi:LysR family transcriptional regulator [Streptomyces hyderabadensis]|uniref:LysR substrate-binding domain-containing protein n=1 Tax=Streptomyces hyderabadensis TaxID=598549 RepID=A0ABP9IQ27_9ACTN|nr:LysR family transcriptional regulator [Streptomyces hyderabadensis]
MSPHPSLGDLPGPADEVVRCLPGLAVFRAVARARTLSEAAAALYKSTASVSRAMSELEAVFGTALVERTRRGTVLTPAGRLVLARADRIDEELSAAATNLARYRPEPGSEVLDALTRRLYDGRHLQLVVRLVNLRTVSAAAAALAMTQSGASMALSRLESALGLRLFRRTAAGMVPFDRTNVLVAHAKRALAELRHLTSDLASTDGGTRGTVVIGTVPPGRTHVMPMAVVDAVGRHPELCVTTVEGHVEQLLAGLRDGDIDVVVGVPPTPSTTVDLAVEPLFEDDLVVLARARHRLADRDRIPMEEVVDEAWILPRAVSPSRRLFDDAFVARGLRPPRATVESADLAVLRQMLATSDTLAFASARQLRFELDSGLVTRLPVDLPALARQVHLVLRRGALLSPATAALVACLRVRGTQAR